MNCEGKVAVVTGAAGGGLDQIRGSLATNPIVGTPGTTHEDTRERGDTGSQVDHHVVTRHRLADGSRVEKVQLDRSRAQALQFLPRLLAAPNRRDAVPRFHK